MPGAGPPGAIQFSPDVERAREAGVPLVALESSVLSLGLRPPANREAAARMHDAVLAAGAVPAITAVVRGRPTLGLTSDDLERFLDGSDVVKVSARDLPIAIARGVDAATTVAAALALCRAAGVTVFATGGIGGVHQEPAFDESADLAELARCPVIAVSAGAKSILDLPATVERLETLGVTVVGYRTDSFPGFFCSDTDIPLSAVVTNVEEVVEVWRGHRRLGLPGAVLVVQPPPAEHALPRSTVDRAVDAARAEAKQAGVRGAALTPFLLAAIDRATSGQSVSTNVALLQSNAALAGEIAVATARAGAS